MSSRPALRYACALPASALIVVLLGLARLTQQFPAAAESPGLLIPFFMPAVALALEAGAFVALTIALLPRTAPASSPRAALPVFGLCVASLAIAALLPRGTERPGALANDLIARSEAGCAGDAASVSIPLLGLTVQCTKPRRIEGPMPGAGSVRLGMRELRFSDDLRGARITDLDLAAARSLSVRLRVQTASIVGLSPWTRSPRLSSLERFAVLLGTALALALAAIVPVRSVRRAASAPPKSTGEDPSAASEPGARDVRSKFFEALLGALPGTVAAALMIWLDQRQAGAGWYCASAVAAAAVLLTLRISARHQLAPGSGPFLSRSGG